jgi:hypothetical protein
MKFVSIVTVNFNYSYLTEALIESIFKTNTYSPIEIIVVDNGSKIDPVPEWRNKYPEVIFIRNEKNLGFAGGNNVGINAAKGDYYFLVNNDTEFTSGLVGKLVDTLELHPEVGMVSPKIRYFDQPDILQYAGYTPMNYFTARNKQIGQFETDNGQYDHLTGITGFGHGAAMMIQRKAIDKAGQMSENFFLYYEELDWCDRIKHAGFDIWINMNALIYHKESVSVGKKSELKEYFMNRNRILYIRRNASFFKRIVFYFYFILVVTPRNIIAYIKYKQYGFIAMLLKAIWWNITNSTNSKQLGYRL